MADAAYLAQLGYSSVALLGNYYDGSLDNQLAGKFVVLMLDGDAMGIVGAMRIERALRICRTKLVVLPDSKDPTDFDAGEIKALIYGKKEKG